MVRSIAWMLLGALCLLLAIIIWKSAPEIHRFAVEPRSAGLKDEKSYFREEFINAGQKLDFVHVASIAELDDHTLAALWYGGPYEYSRANTVYFARQLNGSWLKPRAIMTAPRAENDLGRPIKCLGNPLFLPYHNGSLRLLFVTIAMGKWSGSQLNTSVSQDGGLTWSQTERLSLSPFFNLSELVRNRPIPTSDGWCVPIYQEFLGKFPELLWLKDVHGNLVARKTRIAGGCSSFQPSLIPLDARRAVVLLRDYTDARRIFLSRSADGGLSWSKPVATNLPNPDAGISGLQLGDGRLLVAYNDSTSKRDSLSLALSSDEGGSWEQLATLESDRNKSFSYPYLIQSSDGVIHMAYSWNSTLIKMVSFNMTWISEQKAKNTKP